jgi:hypothetical protein
MWVHLRQGLQPEAIDWMHCLDPFSPEDEGFSVKPRDPLLGYGVHREIQDALAKLRTDLDSFSDAEAHGLMCSAYLMTRMTLESNRCSFAHRPELLGTWRFRDIEPHLKSPQSFTAPVPRAIQKGEQLPLKAWRLSPRLAAVGSLVLFALAVAGLYALALVAQRFRWLDIAAVGIRSPIVIASSVGLLAVGVVFVRWLMRKYGNVGEVIERGSIGVLTAALWLPMWIHRVVFDPIFLRAGRYKPERPRAS